MIRRQRWRREVFGSSLLVAALALVVGWGLRTRTSARELVGALEPAELQAGDQLSWVYLDPRLDVGTPVPRSEVVAGVHAVDLAFALELNDRRVARTALGELLGVAHARQAKDLTQHHLRVLWALQDGLSKRAIDLADQADARFARQMDSSVYALAEWSEAGRIASVLSRERYFESAAFERPMRRFRGLEDQSGCLAQVAGLTEDGILCRRIGASARALRGSHLQPGR